MIHHVQPVTVLHLFPVLDAKLISLLRSLSREDWDRQTIARKWTVKDVAAHLLDGNLRTISIIRDGYNNARPENIGSYKELVEHINQVNAEWVDACRRLSPEVITNLLEKTGTEFTRVLAELDPWGDAVFPVAWAGEEVSRNWFHVAREYTEKWLHQQQIRDAVGQDGLLTPELFTPFIETIMCALPFAYKQVEAEIGTSVMVRMELGTVQEWHINRTAEGWVLRRETRVQPDAIIEIGPDTAWRLFSKCMTPEEAWPKVKITGDADLGRRALALVAVMA
jgi:uncharacterized protein (TIGR03083 family)